MIWRAGGTQESSRETRAYPDFMEGVFAFLQRRFAINKVPPFIYNLLIL
jgi:hypothetical protein